MIKELTMEKTSLPDGWSIKVLSDFTETINGLWTGKKEPYIPVKVYTMSNFTKGCDLNHSKKAREVIASVSQYEKRKLKYGDIIIEKSGGGPNQPVGRAVLFNIKNNEENTFSNFTTRLRICEKNKIDVNSNYLHKFLKLQYLTGVTEKFQKNSTNIRNLQLKEYLQLEIPLPPLNQQKQIVATLDKAFASLDTAKANAEQNLQNAKELFDSYLQNVFENKGDDWEEEEFGNIITTLTDYHANGSYKTLKKNVELKDNDGYAWMIRSTDFEKKFKNQFKYIDEHAYNFMSKSKVLGNEIIMSKIGNAGKIYLMPKIEGPTSLAMNLFLIRLDEKKAFPEFIFHFLKSKKGESQIQKRVKGATTKTITKDNVRNIIITYPSIKKQSHIIIKTKELSIQTKQLEAIYTQKIADLDEMKKSVLQKAFSGQLNTIE